MDDTPDLRPLLPEDKEQLFFWRNLPHVRGTMRTRHVIARQEHERWFASLPSARSCYLIWQWQGAPAGLVNFTGIDRESLSADWGFYLGRQDLPAGSGTAMCRAGLEYAAKNLGLKTIRAEVWNDNPKSMRIHHKLGFIVTARNADSTGMTLRLE